MAIKNITNTLDTCGCVTITTDSALEENKIYRKNQKANKFEKIILKKVNDTTYRDYWIGMGSSYNYSLSQDGSPSKSISDCYLENAILFDSNKFLSLKFNPQVSSFKTVIQEQKVETIGSQYPFYFRNPSINYKEFPIGALITNYENTNNNQLTNYNFEQELDYKIEILNWLNDGKPKIFRSPAEGSYIVRLSGVSLSPQTGLGRMLHSFTATATEIQEYNQDNVYSLMGV